MALGDVIDYPYTYPPTRLNFQHIRLRTPSTHEFKLCTQLTKGDNEIALKKVTRETYALSFLWLSAFNH